MKCSELSRLEREADGVLVTFSDRIIVGYVVEELLDLRPVREKAKQGRTTCLPCTIGNLLQVRQCTATWFEGKEIIPKSIDVLQD